MFLSYARIDGEVVAKALAAALEERGVSVWFDAVAIQPGKSQSLSDDAPPRAIMGQSAASSRRCT